MNILLTLLATAVFLETGIWTEPPVALLGWAWIPAAISAASTIAGGMGASESAGATKDAMRAQAHEYRRQAFAQAQKMDRQHRQLRGRQIASVYASGVDMKGSSKKYVEEQRRLMHADVEEVKEQGRRGFEAIKRGASMQFDAAQWQIAAQGLQGAANVWNTYSANKGK